MRAPSRGKVRWKWRRKRRGVQLCLEEDNLRNTTGTMESIRSELLCQKDAFGRCFICPSLDSKLELAKATSWGRGIRSDFPFPTGIWSYRLTSKRSKTLLISLSAVSGVGSYLCRREGHSELSSPCPPWYRTLQMPQLKDLAVEFCFTPAPTPCFEPLLISFCVEETLLQTSRSLRDPPGRAKGAIKQQGRCSAFISLQDWVYPRVRAMNRNPSSTHSWWIGIWDCWGCKAPVNEADHSGQIESEVPPTLC